MCLRLSISCCPENHVPIENDTMMLTYGAAKLFDGDGDYYRCVILSSYKVPCETRHIVCNDKQRLLLELRFIDLGIMQTNRTAASVFYFGWSVFLVILRRQSPTNLLCRWQIRHYPFRVIRLTLFDTRPVNEEWSDQTPDYLKRHLNYVNPMKAAVHAGDQWWILHESMMTLKNNLFAGTGWASFCSARTSTIALW